MGGRHRVLQCSVDSRGFYASKSRQLGATPVARKPKIILSPTLRFIEDYKTDLRSENNHDGF